MCVSLWVLLCSSCVSSVLEDQIRGPSTISGKLFFLSFFPKEAYRRYVCLNLKLQVSNHLGWRVEVRTEAAGVGPVSTPVVEVPSEHKHILVTVETTTSKEVCPLLYMSMILCTKNTSMNFITNQNSFLVKIAF